MFKTLLILILIFISVLGQTTKKPKSRNELMKDLFRAGSLKDLNDMGIKIVLKPQGISGGIPGRSALEDLRNAKDATPGKCDPKPVCITNPLTSNLNSNDQVAFPPCINIHRCDGCCPENEVCVAIGIEELKLKNVAVLSLNDNHPNAIAGDIISVTNHTECECQCKWKNDDDCKVINSNFVKSQNSCECVCSSEISCNSLHQFDRESCSCKCHTRFSASERNCRNKGFIWNEHYCKCDPIRTHTSIRDIKNN